MPVECTVNLGTALVSFAGVIIGGVVGFFSARNISDRNAYATARAKLHSAFAPALAIIYIARHHGTHDCPPVDATIKNLLLNHAAAVEEFRPFVSEHDRPAYQTAWEKYRQIAAQCEFSTAGEEWGLELEAGELLNTNIRAVLRFSEK